MASKTFYLLPDQSAGTSAHGTLQDGGSAPAAADCNSQWKVGIDSPSNYAEYLRNIQRQVGDFTTTVQPDGIIDNVHGDCLRTQNPYVGQFASGTWTFTFGIRSNIIGGSPSAALRIRLFRSTDPGGASATEITSSTQQSGNFPSSTTAETATISFNPGAFSLNNEYLFVELALLIQAAANIGTMTWILQTGPAFLITTSDWADPIVAFRRKRKPNRKRPWWKKKSRWQPPNGVPPPAQPYPFPRKKKWRRNPKHKKKRRINSDWIAYAPATSPPLFPFPWPRRKKRRKTPPRIKKHRPPQMVSFYRQFAPALCGHTVVLSSVAAKALALERMTATTDTRVMEAIANFKKASPNRVFETLSATAKEFEALTAKATTICCQ